MIGTLIFVALSMSDGPANTDNIFELSPRRILSSWGTTAGRRYIQYSRKVPLDCRTHVTFRPNGSIYSIFEECWLYDLAFECSLP